MTAAQRFSLANQMSAAARDTTLAAIKTRQPDYSELNARWALFRMLVGDELFRRAWPHAPLVALNDAAKFGGRTAVIALR